MNILVTGNTVIDALHIVQKQFHTNFPLCKRGMKGDFNTIMRCHLRKPIKGVRKPAWAHRILGAVLRAQDPRCLVEGTNSLRPSCHPEGSRPASHPEGSRPASHPELVSGSQCKMVLITGHRRENKKNHSSPFKRERTKPALSKAEGVRVGMLEPDRLERLNRPKNPFGDATAAKRIVSKIKRSRPE